MAVLQNSSLEIMVILYKNNTWRRKMRTKIPEISINKRICYI